MAVTTDGFAKQVRVELALRGAADRSLFVDLALTPPSPNFPQYNEYFKGSRYGRPGHTVRLSETAAADVTRKALVVLCVGAFLVLLALFYTFTGIEPGCGNRATC